MVLKQINHFNPKKLQSKKFFPQQQKLGLMMFIGSMNFDSKSIDERHGNIKLF